jgi:hypothetical protein
MVIEFTWSSRRRKEGARKVERGALQALGGGGAAATLCIEPGRFLHTKRAPSFVFSSVTWAHSQVWTILEMKVFLLKLEIEFCLYLPPHLLPNTIHGGLGHNKWWTQLRIEILLNQCQWMQLNFSFFFQSVLNFDSLQCIPQ